MNAEIPKDQGESDEHEKYVTNALKNIASETLKEFDGLYQRLSNLPDLDVIFNLEDIPDSVDKKTKRSKKITMLLTYLFDYCSIVSDLEDILARSKADAESGLIEISGSLAEKLEQMTNFVMRITKYLNTKQLDEDAQAILTDTEDAILRAQIYTAPQKINQDEINGNKLS